MKQNKNKKLSKVINKKNFSFRPYTFTPRGVVELQLYADLGGSTILLSIDEAPMKVLTWLAIISPALIPLITETAKGVISYNIQHVMRQLSYDQLTVMVTDEIGYSNLLSRHNS